MRTTFLKWALLLSVILLPARGLIAENLLANGSFEAGRFGWFLYTEYGTGSRIEVLDTGSRFGERCLRLERTSEIGNVWLMHDYVKLDEDKDYSFSVWLRSESDSLPVALQIFCYDGTTIGKGHEGSQTVTVGKEWNRHHLIWKTPKAALGMYRPRIKVIAPGTLYVDGAQLEQGAVGEFAPKATIELGLSPNHEDSLYHLNDKTELAILVANSGGEDRRLEARVRITDYDDQKVADKGTPLVAGAGKTGEVMLDLTQERLGYYRAEVELLDEKGEKIAGGRWAFALVPEAGDKPDVKFGICMGQENIELTVGFIRKLGIGAVRQHCALLWGNTEKEKGKFTWDQDIPSIRAVREAGMEPLVYLMTVPQWALDPEKSKTNRGGFPRELADYALAVKETVRACKEWMSDWEIVNEASIWYEPEAYFSLLKVAYEAAKEADPNCTVIGISGFANDEKLIPYVLDQGGLKYMDVLSIHSYTVLGNVPEFGFPRDWEKVRRLIREHGGETPIWMTEFGWRATDWPLMPDFEGARIDVGDEKTQADYLVRGEVISFACGVKRFYYFMLYFGLPYTDNIVAGDSLASPKKVVVALAGLTRMLSGLDFREKWDVGSDNIWAVRFSDDKRQVLVAWAPYEDDVLVLSCDTNSTKLYDIAGNEEPITAGSGGLTRIGLSATPVYVEAPLNADIKPETILRISPLEKIDPEETKFADLTVTATNPFAEALSGELLVTVPEGWQAQPKSVALNLKPRETRELKFRITPSQNFPEAQPRIRFELKRGLEGSPIAAADRVPTFRPGPPPKPQYSIWIEAESATEKDSLFTFEKADRAYGRTFLTLGTTDGPPTPPGYFSAKIPFPCPKGADFTLLMIGNPLNVPYMSPLWWRIDSGEWHRAWDLPQEGKPYNPWPGTGDTGKFWGVTNLGKVRLGAGEHILELRIDEPCQLNSWYVLYADAFALVEEKRQ